MGGCEGSQLCLVGLLVGPVVAAFAVDVGLPEVVREDQLGERNCLRGRLAWPADRIAQPAEPN